ncbi:hypothetical protein D0864_07529 [Hortaea werneckii]|uniref:Protein kinase domain-containing protein n=1 Tax=Hortaea werneckii TaxID=91943 RepID=A0A3M7F6M0_HORWE|nr:hypothetical protein D0864_07529 [Hortaea werneckii]
MDYETPDGSQFSLLPVWQSESGDSPRFMYTSVSAFVDGNAYTGKIQSFPEDVEDEELLACLQPVPPECIHPNFPEGFTVAPEYEASKHYLKAPSFTYALAQPGVTKVAESVLNEAKMMELLKKHPHENLAQYYGCVVAEGRIKQLCLQRYDCNLMQWMHKHHDKPPQREVEAVLDDIEAGIEHLHSLGFAHNDLNPENICIDQHNRAVLVDFDCCIPLGEVMPKGESVVFDEERDAMISDRGNDFHGMDDIADFLLGGSTTRDAATP